MNHAAWIESAEIALQPQSWVQFMRPESNLPRYHCNTKSLVETESNLCTFYCLWQFLSNDPCLSLLTFMKCKCHFPNQHQKLYHISKAQLNTFFNRNLFEPRSGFRTKRGLFFLLSSNKSSRTQAFLLLLFWVYIFLVMTNVRTTSWWKKGDKIIEMYLWDFFLEYVDTTLE